ncbi:hypothetical protein KC343_g14617 [Hortaea werneckii]|uniref:Endosomal/vacuolar adapter protein YPT35 n=1 Tax=Hortaea werneckii TaxID=91943 RepID=A0A3M7BXK3_HORWE|nr:hypothetical protein KC317_g15808 [Hortaea werneckii]KAI7601737.1 hypothetical protein KC346_g12668 [Hortaea werneckii]KAI7603091.1 hypothetical protein KC343_g14617 [Hortaea werneckii]KAI7643941.1 hypothetical protein KC319_g12469 [Hortaea werneckii]KAI7686636.1 hypothetical protein KC322_g12716 [Hortaea werneckii]
MRLDTAAANSLTHGPTQATPQQQQQQQSQPNPQSEPQAAISPPFWTPHARTISSASSHSLDDRATGPHPISLEDHTTDTASHHPSQSCWAQSVTIDSYTILTGPTGIGAYVVWSCRISVLPQTTSTNSDDPASDNTPTPTLTTTTTTSINRSNILHLRKRYSEFDTLRTNLVRSFPHAEAMIPALPRKSVVSKFRPWFLEQRRSGLEHFLNCILLNPEFAASPVVKGFVFE